MATAQTDVLTRQSKIPKVAGEIWRAENLKLSGFEAIELHRDLFVRNEMLLLWNEVASVINSHKQVSSGIITGCPGVGKSTEVFCQLTYYATTRKVDRRMNCIWMHYSGGKIVSILVIVNGCAHYTKFVGEPDINVFTELIYWCINAEIHVIALNGAWKNQLGFACTIGSVARDSNRRLAIIICTSQQSVNLSSSLFSRIMPSIFCVPAWEEEDLRSAYDAGLLAVSGEREFDEVYFYAGGAIRLYGFASLNIIQTFLCSKLFEIGDVNAAIRDRLGEASAAAVNTLKCTYRSSSKESTWLSQFVTHNIMENADASLLKPLYRNTMGNNSFRGWVLEADLMRRVVNKKTIKLLGADGMQAFDVKVAYIDRFGTSAPPANVSNLKDGQSLFVIPTEFNNALWDGIVVEKRGDKDFKIILLQVTCSSAHLFKCGHISKVLTWLFPEVVNTTRKAGMHCGEIWFYAVVETVEDIRRFTPNFIDVVNVKNFDPNFDADDRLLVYSLFYDRRE
jgi:hypothetical protein